MGIGPRYVSSPPSPTSVTCIKAAEQAGHGCPSNEYWRPKAVGSQGHSRHRFQNRKPQVVGTWTLRVCLASNSGFGVSGFCCCNSLHDSSFSLSNADEDKWRKVVRKDLHLASRKIRASIATRSHVNTRRCTLKMGLRGKLLMNPNRSYMHHKPYQNKANADVPYILLR